MIELPVRNTLVMYNKRLYHNMKRLNDLFVARCQTTYILGCVATMIRRQNWRAEVDGRMTDCQNSTNWKHLLKQRESYAARPSIMLCVNCLLVKNDRVLCGTAFNHALYKVFVVHRRRRHTKPDRNMETKIQKAEPYDDMDNDDLSDSDCVIDTNVIQV